MKPVCQRHRSGDSEAVVQANLLLEYVTGDWMRVVLTNLHPKDGLSAMFLCKGVRSSLGSLDTMWEMWAHTLWPRNTVIPAIPCLYPTFEALVRDNNRRGAMRAVLWPDHVGRNQQISSWSRNTPSRFYCCRVLAVEHDQHNRLIMVHFDVRGEADLLPPCGAKLWLGRAGEKDDRGSCLVETRPKTHSLQREQTQELYTVQSTSSNAAHEWYTGAGFGGSGGAGRRCVGHLTFQEDRLLYPATREPAIIQGGSQERLQLNFTYASHMGVPMLNYTRATLAEWPAREEISLGQAIAKYHRSGGEFGYFPVGMGGVSASVAALENEDIVEHAKTKRFCYAPDLVKKRRQWWV